MKYFKKDNEVYAYDEQQLAQGYGKDMIPMTDEEVELHINPIPTEAQILAEKVAEALAYLASTDFKVLPDYEPKSEEVVALRATAREFIRNNDVPNS